MTLEDVFYILFVFIGAVIPAVILILFDSKKIDMKLGILLYFIMIALEISLSIQFGFINIKSNVIASYPTPYIVP